MDMEKYSILIKISIIKGIFNQDYHNIMEFSWLIIYNIEVKSSMEEHKEWVSIHKVIYNYNYMYI